MRLYVLFYAQITKLLQRRKILLMKIASSKEKSKKIYVKSARILESISIEIIIYEHLQSLFFILIFLIHHDSNRRLYIDVDAFKQMKFEIMIFHVKNDLDQNISFKKKTYNSSCFWANACLERRWIIDQQNWK